MEDSNKQTVEHLFRTEYGKVLAIITKYFGVSYIELAEDIVQDALIAAMTDWSINGTPKNPTAWLVQVAKRKAFNEIKRNKMMHEHHQSELLAKSSIIDINDIFLADEIEDSRLRMIFTCCHSDLNLESQIALTLKILCGFSSKEIAKSLLTTESTVNKRLYRAKETIRNSNLPFQVPQGNELLQRLEAVSLTLYLLFNQGYNSTTGCSIIQKELCLEAIRLTKLLVSKFTDNSKMKALLSLMCLHTARFDARLDHKGTLVLFADQDRGKWNDELINIGMNYFRQALKGKFLSTYHIEARIAAEHCLSKSFEDTNWQVIYEQYELLYSLKPNPIIKLNLAIIQSKITGFEQSVSMLKALEKSNELRDYYLFPATLGIFSMENSSYKEALNYLKKTLKLSPSQTEKSYIESKIEICKKMLSTTKRC